jgi:hypothetical protein
MSMMNTLGIVSTQAAVALGEAPVETWGCSQSAGASMLASISFVPFVFVVLAAATVAVLTTLWSGWVTPRWSEREALWTVAAGSTGGLAALLCGLMLLSGVDARHAVYLMPLVVVGAPIPLAFATVCGLSMHRLRCARNPR